MIRSGVAGAFSLPDDKYVPQHIIENLYRKLLHRGAPIFIYPQHDKISTEFREPTEQIMIQFTLCPSEGSVLSTSDSIIIMDGFLFNQNPKFLPESIPKNLDGHFVICKYLKQKHRLEIYRDSIGPKPLFYTFWKNTFIFASERKALPAINQAKRLPPGHRIILEHSDVSIEEYFYSNRPPSIHEPISDISKLTKTLGKLLRESIEFLAEKTTAIMFSGGLDSSLITWITKDIVDVEIFSVGLPDSKDIKWTRHAADMLGLNLNLKIIQPDDLDDYLQKTIYALEENDPLKAVIGLPIYAACEFIKDNGMRVAFAGQGADEIFGGYAKYLNLEPNMINDALYHDVKNLYHTNLERDNMIAMANSIDLRLPYLYPKLVRFAFSIPATLKIFHGERKYILRKAALELGLPRDIALRSKKAIQYSTGVKKHVEKIAKKKGYTLSKYVKHIFNRIYGS